MRPSEALAAKRDEVRAIIEGSCVSNPRIFGSVARGEDTETSDLDLLVDVAVGASLFDLAGTTIALEDLLGVRVDLIDEGAIKPRFKLRIKDDIRPL